MCNTFVIENQISGHLARGLSLLQSRHMQNKISARKLLHLQIKYLDILKCFQQRSWNYGKFKFCCLNDYVPFEISAFQ